MNSFLVQMHRGLQLESTYSSFILLFQNLGLTKVYIESAGPLIASMDIISPAASFLSEIAWFAMATLITVHRQHMYIFSYQNNHMVDHR